MPTTYLTPDQLQITPAEYEALIWVREKLLDGTIQDKPLVLKEASVGGKFLNMAMEYDRVGCGTIACIGGWVALRMKWPGVTTYVDDYLNTGKPIEALYWDNFEANPAQAAVAVDNFLRYGNPKWAEACASKHPAVLGS